MVFRHDGLAIHGEKSCSCSRLRLGDRQTNRQHTPGDHTNHAGTIPLPNLTELSTFIRRGGDSRSLTHWDIFSRLRMPHVSDLTIQVRGRGPELWTALLAALSGQAPERGLWATDACLSVDGARPPLPREREWHTARHWVARRPTLGTVHP